MGVPLDERVRERIVAETRGNPLALLELPRGLTPARAGGRVRFAGRARVIGADRGQLPQAVGGTPGGDPAAVAGGGGRAGRRPGAGVAGGRSGSGSVSRRRDDTDGLLEIGARVTFRHPLVRSAVYRAASPEDDRQAVHRALADATDPEVDPDRRAWHLAHATPGFDEEVAAELERSAGRAQARGGLAAAAAFLERAAALTPEPSRRAGRALAAAQAKQQAGAFDAALGLLAIAESGPLDELQRAQVDLLRGQIAFALSRGSDAPPLLLKAAKRLEPLDLRLARDTYLEALTAVLFPGRLASTEMCWRPRGPPGQRLHRRSLRARPDLLLDGLAVLITDGYAAGAPTLRRAIDGFRDEEISRGDGRRWLWLASRVAAFLWDDENWDMLSARFVELARDAGALSVLPLALTITHGGASVRRAASHGLFAGRRAGGG